MGVKEDTSWAKAHHLNPLVKDCRAYVVGDIAFRAHYNGKSLLLGEHIPATVAPDRIIEDRWSIKLIHDYSMPFKAPHVYETAGRIKKTAHERNINDLRDMHLNTGGEMPPDSFCVAIKFELEKEYSTGFSLEHYITNFLIPFLYQQSYFDKHKDWPWNNYPHGELGYYVYSLEHHIRS